MYGNLLARLISARCYTQLLNRAVYDNDPELRDGFYERPHRNVEENSQFITVLWVRSRRHSSSVLQ